MANYRVLATLPYDSGLPQDVIQNTWYCIADNDAAAANFGDALIDFYQTIDASMSSIINNGTDACSLRFYDLADPEPRLPAGIINFTLADATGSSLPPEVALCLSFTSTVISGTNRARRRGRVFLGPWETGGQSSDGRVGSVLQDTVRDAAQVLLDASQAATTWVWAQHSTTENSTLEVLSGYVDNEWDTQRRRGYRATTRFTFT